jgi:hypothetical protein
MNGYTSTTAAASLDTPGAHAPQSTAAAPSAASQQAVWSHPQSGLSDPRRKSPALACFLSVMPGLGQVYVGYYTRGFVHAIVVASLIALLGSDGVRPLEPLLAFFLAFFWLYNIIDAGRRAALCNYALAGMAQIELPEDFTKGGIGGSILGGAVLVIAGIVLLSKTLFGMPLDWVADWWPVAPILFGAYLIAKAVADRRKTA